MFKELSGTKMLYFDTGIMLQHRYMHAPDYLHGLAALTIDSSEDLELLQKFHNVAACARHSQSRYRP